MLPSKCVPDTRCRSAAIAAAAQDELGRDDGGMSPVEEMWRTREGFHAPFGEDGLGTPDVLTRCFSLEVLLIKKMQGPWKTAEHTPCSTDSSCFTDAF